MKLTFEDKNTSGLLVIHVSGEELRSGSFPSVDTLNTLVCNLNAEQTVWIDETSCKFPQNTILPLMANQRFVFERPEELIAWQFNREFYCIADHDAEVGCAGFLFYGITNPMFINIDGETGDQLKTIEKQFRADLEYVDNMQAEMLRTILKRLIITVTRLGKKQVEKMNIISNDKFQLMRNFSLLVEVNFRKNHDVSFYAKSLNKSPKTLANIFCGCGYPSPSQIIQQRLVLESKRYLYYTDKSSKEIAFELGFSSPAHFSAYFKRYTGKNASELRDV